MLKDPTISVVMSVYNEPIQWIRESINSILNQTISDIEFIIILDNPQNIEAKELLLKYSYEDNRVKLLFNDFNIGLTKSLNKGLAVAKGEFIARMDADDISLPTRLEEEISYFRNNPTVSICHTNYDRINSTGQIICKSYVNPQKSGREWVAWTNPLGHSTVMFRSNLCKLRNPLYNEDFKRTQDYELWAFFALEDCEFGFINKSLLLYRESELQVTHFHKGNQDSNLYKIRHNYILNYLYNKRYTNKVDVNAEEILYSLKKSPIKKSFQDEISMILYLAYYTASSEHPKYAIQFLFDKRCLLFKYGIRYTSYILLNFIFKHKWDAYLL